MLHFTSIDLQVNCTNTGSIYIELTKYFANDTPDFNKAKIDVA